jgi:hypothetical protein
MRTCLNCGDPMPEVPFWKRMLFGSPPPFHDPEGPYGESCWRGLNRRFGVRDPGPRPQRSRRA